jgi:hypothetical protein
MNHDRLIERLGTVLESSLMDATAQLQILANIGVSGGMQQWFQRSQDLLERKAKLTNSVQQAQSVSQARGVEQAQIVVQAQVVEQENRHRVAIQKLEQENERLRKQVGDRINDLQVAEIKQDDERRTWLGGVCAMQ